MMKILHVYKTYYPNTKGGIEETIFQLSEQLSECGIISTVVSTSKNTGYYNQTCNKNHHSLVYKEDFNISSNAISSDLFFNFRQLVKNSDIVHYHFPWPFMDFLHLTLGFKHPSIITYHSDIVRQKLLLRIYSPIMHLFINNVDALVATSPNYAFSSSILTTYSNKVSVIPIGIKNRKNFVIDRKTFNKWNLYLGKNTKFLLFLGNLRYYKGLETLLEAMKIQEFPLVIIGSGEYDERIRRLSKSYKLQNIYFTGEISDVDKLALLNMCYLVVLPSNIRTEAYGVALVEGAMFGKPLICCEIGTGTSYININEQTGLVVPPNDSYKLLEAIRRIWNDELLAKNMGEAAYRRYLDYFTVEKMAEKYKELYIKILSSHANRAT